MRQIQDKFPEKKGGLKELYEKGPAEAFFLVKFWADLNNPGSASDGDHTFYGVTTTYESGEQVYIRNLVTDLMGHPVSTFTYCDTYSFQMTIQSTFTYAHYFPDDHPELDQGVQLRQAGRREAGDGVRAALPAGNKHKLVTKLI